MLGIERASALTIKMTIKLKLVIILLVLITKDSSADVPICTHDTMGDHAFCFPPEYNKVILRRQMDSIFYFKRANTCVTLNWK